MLHDSRHTPFGFAGPSQYPVHLFCRYEQLCAGEHPNVLPPTQPPTHREDLPLDLRATVVAIESCFASSKDSRPSFRDLVDAEHFRRQSKSVMMQLNEHAHANAHALDQDQDGALHLGVIHEIPQSPAFTTAAAGQTPARMLSAKSMDSSAYFYHGFSQTIDGDTVAIHGIATGQRTDASALDTVANHGIGQ